MTISLLFCVTRALLSRASAQRSIVFVCDIPELALILLGMEIDEIRTVEADESDEQQGSNDQHAGRRSQSVERRV